MYSVSPSYLPMVATGGRYTIRCAAYREDSVVSGAEDLALFSGSVTDESRPGVRRQLSLEVAPEPGLTVQGLFDLLEPSGTELRVRSVLGGESVPMGVFDVSAQTMGYGQAGTLALQADDKWARIQRARFPIPVASTVGATVTDQIVTLIRGALGLDEPVVVTATSGAVMGSVVWERDRDKAIIELAKSIGAWCYFDREGVATVADVPTITDSVWEIDDTLLGAQRSRDRSKTYNVVVVSSEKVDGTPLFDPVVVSDDDPTSPTYVGGSFLSIPYFYSSPLLQDAEQARKAGITILRRVKGLNAQLTMSTVRNHALDVLDTTRVLLPQVRWDVPRPVEVHMVDKIVHPLTAEGEQSIDTRATRADDLE